MRSRPTQLAAALALVLGRAELGVNDRRRCTAAAAAFARGRGPPSVRGQAGRCHRFDRCNLVSPCNPFHQLHIVCREDAALGRLEALVARRQVNRDLLGPSVEQRVRAPGVSIPDR